MDPMSELELRHYASKPFVFDRDRVYEQKKPHGFGKPVGFWVSVAGADDWAAWCESEGYGIGGFEHRVTLDPGANVLVIDTPSDIEAFHEKYSVETEFEARARSLFPRATWPVDWRKVVQDFDGLVIAPYQYSLRFDGPEWYYGWDCASGCIWSAHAVLSVEVTA
jgi:hypothetical protein